jgi:two-component system, sensor histidine kinase and response regulator
MMQPDELSPEPVLDLSELHARVENDYELLRELITIAKVEIPRHLELLHEAVAQADVKSIENSGHSLKGMLLYLSASRAAAAADHLEQLGRSGDTATLKSAVAIFESEIVSLMPELEACMENTRR